MFHGKKSDIPSPNGCESPCGCISRRYSRSRIVRWQRPLADFLFQIDPQSTDGDVPDPQSHPARSIRLLHPDHGGTFSCSWLPYSVVILRDSRTGLQFHTYCLLHPTEEQVYQLLVGHAPEPTQIVHMPIGRNDFSKNSIDKG